MSFPAARSPLRCMRVCWDTPGQPCGLHPAPGPREPTWCRGQGGDVGPHHHLTPRVHRGLARWRGMAQCRGHLVQGSCWVVRAGESDPASHRLRCMSPVPVTLLPASAPSHEARWDEVSPENPLPASLSPSPAMQHHLHHQRSTKTCRKPQRGRVICSRWDYLNFFMATPWLRQPRPEQSETAGNKFPSPCLALQVFQDYSNLCVLAAFSQRGLCVQYGRLQPFGVIYVHKFGVIGRA